MADKPQPVHKPEIAALITMSGPHSPTMNLSPVDEAISHATDDFVRSQAANVDTHPGVNTRWEDMFDFNEAATNVPIARHLTAAENDEFTALWNSLDGPVSTAAEEDQQVPSQAGASTAPVATMQHNSDKNEIVENHAQPAVYPNAVSDNTGGFKDVPQDIDHSLFGVFPHDDPSQFNFLTDEELMKLEIPELSDEAFQQSLLTYNQESTPGNPQEMTGFNINGSGSHAVPGERSKGEVFDTIDRLGPPAGGTPAASVYTGHASLMKPLATPVNEHTDARYLAHSQKGYPSVTAHAKAPAHSLTGQTSMVPGHSNVYPQVASRALPAAPPRPRYSDSHGSVRTGYRMLPLPPSSSAFYAPGIGWYVHSNAGDSGAQFNLQIGYYRPLMAQRFIAMQQLTNIIIPADAPFTTEAGMKQSKKRPASDVAGEFASGRNNRPLLPSTPPSFFPSLHMTSQHSQQPQRPPRTEFPYDASHPLKGRKGSFDILRECTCENITLPDRAPNSFMLFRSEYAKSAGKLGQTKISEDASEAWKRLDNPSKRHYEGLAKERENTLLQAHPNYRYVPKAKEMIRFGFADCFCGAYAYNLAHLNGDPPQMSKKGAKRQRIGRDE